MFYHVYFGSNYHVMDKWCFISKDFIPGPRYTGQDYCDLWVWGFAKIVSGRNQTDFLPDIIYANKRSYYTLGERFKDVLHRYRSLSIYV